MIRSVVQGCGAYLPDRVVSNDELAKKVDTSDEWIQQRTGIRQRHIAADGEFTSHLATKAAERALAHAGMQAADLDLIILATATPDETFPATATRVQAALGMTRGAAFDVQAVCAGFVYAVSVADSMIKSGAATTAEQAGTIFVRVKPKLAVYSHIVPGDASDLIPLTRKTYSGPLEVGEDLMSLEIGESVVVHRAAKVN